MTQMRRAVRRRRAATVGSLAALGVAAVASLAIAANDSSPSTPNRGASKCDAASVDAADSSIRELRNSIRCLINEKRAIRGFGKLDRNESLKVASQRHVKKMVETKCLAHQCPNEDDLETRLERAGYFDDAKSWRYAENTGCGISAAAMIANWLDTVYHRVNLLDPDFRDIGVGVSHERVTGRCRKGYATFAVVFGERTP